MNVETQTGQPQAAATAQGKKPREKRSWSRITTAIDATQWTFWPTPDGLHLRKKGSPNVRTTRWPELLLAMNGGRHAFEHDSRHYEVWREADASTSSAAARRSTR